MIQIRPVSDLRNKFAEIENVIQDGPVYLTKNGYGTMVLMSLDNYSRLTDAVENALDLADYRAETSSERLTHDEVFGRLRKEISENR